ncbi:MAG: tRNA 2-selenouridine(34) synthase MnmH [Sphingobacteriaceae bacterium]|nr:tRNA 2-selenouridine(34) synthase MnmH [Sphingobacteriaceae bacterium]
MKTEAIPVNNFLLQSSKKLVIDVRSPIEFKKGHMPGAINIPLFDDMERAEIGTLYKAKGKEDAVMRGLEIVSPKLTTFINEAKKSTQNKGVLVYCFRGGMRSNSFGWLLNTAGLETQILEGGYKAYRNYVLKQFEKTYKILLLGGATGSGKTEILKCLKQDIPILDLEGLAHHKGSAFGGIGQPAQFPQQLFENNFYNDLIEVDVSKYVLIEDESMSIGYNKIPYPFWLQMKQAPIIKIMVSFDLRVNRLVNEYGKEDIEKLKQSVRNISQQLGPNNSKDCLQWLDEGKLADVAALTLKYYDKAYEYNHTQKNKKIILQVETDTDDPIVNAEKVKRIFAEYGSR